MADGQHLKGAVEFAAAFDTAFIAAIKPHVGDVKPADLEGRVTRWRLLGDPPGKYTYSIDGAAFMVTREIAYYAGSYFWSEAIPPSGRFVVRA